MSQDPEERDDINVTDTIDSKGLFQQPVGDVSHIHLWHTHAQKMLAFGVDSQKVHCLHWGDRGFFSPFRTVFSHRVTIFSFLIFSVKPSFQERVLPGWNSCLQ